MRRLLFTLITVSFAAAVFAGESAAEQGCLSCHEGIEKFTSAR